MMMRCSGIRTADLVAVDEIDVVVERVPQHRHLRRVVLRVAVGVENQIARCGGESAAQRAAVAPVPLVVHDPDFRVGARELVDDFRRRVGAAVVDDDDLEVGGQLARGRGARK